MKKYLLMALVAIATFSLSACGGKSDSANDEAAAAAVKDGNKFEGKNFSLVYPKDWKESFASETIFNATAEGDVSFNATYNDFGPAVSELSIYANNWKGLKQNAKVDEPVIDGKTLTIKAVEGGQVEMHFVVMKEDKIGVAGSLKYPEAKDAEMQPVLKGIMNSIEFK